MHRLFVRTRAYICGLKLSFKVIDAQVALLHLLRRRLPRVLQLLLERGARRLRRRQVLPQLVNGRRPLLVLGFRLLVLRVSLVNLQKKRTRM
jgi:hypothetical protein